jgi:uncharacterized membrane protein (UPF0182 family)
LPAERARWADAPAEPASLPWRGVSIAVGFLLLTFAMREYVGRFELLFEHHTIFDGVTYTDAHVSLLGMLFITVALVIGGVIAIAVGVLRPSGRWLALSIVPAAVCFVVFGVDWLVCEHVSREAEPARPRAALHRR